MSKRRYMSPLLLTITPGDDSTPIVIAGSQGTFGYDDQFSINEQDFINALGEVEAAAVIDMIWANCDDIALAEMDTNSDYSISYSEYLAWYNTYEPW